MLDRERILTKIDELEGRQRELVQIAPGSIDEYQMIETKRACERLLQISIETVIDISFLLVKGLRLGLPAEEDDLFEKLAGAGIISQSTKGTAKRMKGFRNILVHRYGVIDDGIVYEMATERLEDFEAFKKEVLQVLSEEDAPVKRRRM